MCFLPIFVKSLAVMQIISTNVGRTGFVASRLTNVYFLTNKDSTNDNPTTDTNSGWSTCYYSSVALGDNYTIQCTNNVTPLTRLFSIKATVKPIELREVEIYGLGKCYYAISFFIKIFKRLPTANSFVAACAYMLF